MTKFIILCEDIDQERFIREYLLCLGINNRNITLFSNLKTSNNASVIRDYPKLVASYRQRKNSQDIAIVVMIDADTSSIHHRLRSLHTALNERAGELNQDPRLPNERIAIFVPARNIETWYEYINGNRNCNEEDDYKEKTLSMEERISLAKKSAIILATQICSTGLDDDAIDSLRHACTELQRLKIH